MALWGDNWFVGWGAIGLIVAAILFFTQQGPFQQCITNGFGAEFCGEDAKAYCRDVSDKLAGRTAACNEVLGESKPLGEGGLMDSAYDGYESATDESLDGDGYDSAAEDYDDAYMEECLEDYEKCSP
jgi:hypothetical protein